MIDSGISPEGPTLQTLPETTGRFVIVFADDADPASVLQDAGVQGAVSSAHSSPPSKDRDACSRSRVWRPVPTVRQAGGRSRAPTRPVLSDFAAPGRTPFASTACDSISGSWSTSSRFAARI